MDSILCRLGYRTIKVIYEILERVSKMLSMFDDSINAIIVPIEEGNSYVEFYNLEKTESTTIENLKNL